MTMHSFQNWVSLPENQSARAAVARVAEGVCQRRVRLSVNPLFLHGPSGTGKSHLADGPGPAGHGPRPDLHRHNPRSARRGRPSGTAVTRKGSTTSPPLDCRPGRRRGLAAPLGPGRRAAGRSDRSLPEPATAAGLYRHAGPAELTDLPGRLTSRLGQRLVVGLLPLSPASRRLFLADRIAPPQPEGTRRRPGLVGRDTCPAAAGNWKAPWSAWKRCRRSMRRCRSRWSRSVSRRGRESSAHRGTHRPARRRLLPGRAAAVAVARALARRPAAAAGRHVPRPPADRAVAGADRRLLRRPRPQHRPARLPQGRASPGPRWPASGAVRQLQPTWQPCGIRTRMLTGRALWKTCCASCQAVRCLAIQEIDLARELRPKPTGMCASETTLHNSAGNRFSTTCS